MATRTEEVTQIYAVVRTGGKQYRVEPNQTVHVEKLPVAQGQQVELTEVLMVGDGDAVIIGQPIISGAKVIAEVLEQGRDDKITVFKYKAKVHYRRQRGHRQPYTRLVIREIVTGTAEKPRTHRRAR